MSRDVSGPPVNDETEPLGRLGPQPLRPGDRLRLGAYMIAVRDNPLDDIDNVRTLVLVFKGGRLVADHRATRATLRS